MRAGALQRTLSALHECESAFYSSRPEGISVRLHQFLLKQDLPLYSYLISSDPIPPSILHVGEETEWLEVEEGEKQERKL